MSEKIQEKTKTKRIEKRLRNDDQKGEKSPMSLAGSPGNPGRRISTERIFFGPFLRFEMFYPCGFPKFLLSRHQICRSSSPSRVRLREYQIIFYREPVDQKVHFLPDRLRNRQDKAHQPAVSNHCLKLHGHPMSINMKIHQ